jgi:hypothetical protein
VSCEFAFLEEIRTEKLLALFLDRLGQATRQFGAEFVDACQAQCYLSKVMLLHQVLLRRHLCLLVGLRIQCVEMAFELFYED